MQKKVKIFTVFNTPDSKGHVGYFHHIAFVLSQLLAFQTISHNSKPCGQLEPNMVEICLGCSFNI